MVLALRRRVDELRTVYEIGQDITATLEVDETLQAILDRRVVTKGYGHVFLKSLPPARRCATFEEVEAWYRAEP